MTDLPPAAPRKLLLPILTIAGISLMVIAGVLLTDIDQLKQGAGLASSSDLSSNADAGSASKGANPALKKYATVAEARKALSADKRFTQKEDNGWTVFVGPGGDQWAFVPKQDPSYPAAIGQLQRDVDGIPNLQSEFLCEGPAKACDELFESYRQMTSQAFSGK